MLSYEASTIFFGSDFSGLLEWGCILRSSYSIKKFKRKQKHCKLQLGYVYKNRVENNKFFFFEIHALLSCERGNSAENGAGKFKICMLF